MAGDTGPYNEEGWFSPRLFRSADLEGNDGGNSSVVGIQAAGISPIGYDAEGETPQDLLELITNQKDEQLPQIATAEQALVEIGILQTQIEICSFNCKTAQQALQQQKLVATAPALQPTLKLSKPDKSVDERAT
jgi:hypothetical protein